ncbi:MAG: type II toxin-antitoxin system VapC family toxin [Nitrospirae bacterium]|nr:type II toxin-antitoxin system VapC family toxin [Nitrospirota bacterium]MCL5284878.1 type II toxin-antitoxin system VapC family toxin [Nitrospirota bacterium]
MTRYMLDTNTVSCLLKMNPVAMQRAREVPISFLCISAVTEGELLSGLAKRPEAMRLHAAVREFLRCVDVLPWDEEAAEHYAEARASLERKGKRLAPLDLLIASHSKSLGAVLVTNDQAFRVIDGLHLEDWSNTAGGSSS